MGDFVRILVDQQAATAPDPDDRGWRYRVLREEGESRIHVYEEQVFPERVERVDANHYRVQDDIGLTHDQARWLIATLTEALAESEREESLAAAEQKLKEREDE